MTLIQAHSANATTGTTLDEAKQQLESAPESAGETIAKLSAQLRDFKRQQSPEQWNATVEECRAHPLRELLHQDPLSARAYAKPRGYQGDAELLDIIYSRDYRPFWPHRVTPLGEALFRYTIQCKAPSAVRSRRDFLASQLDSVCSATPSARILSVACGHLREALMSPAIQSRSFDRFVGLDQDQQSLAVVSQSLGNFGIEPVRGSIKAVFAGPLSSERFDFIYAAGLYDYLEERLCQRLTQSLFEMLRPGGRLLVANYLPDIEDVGYMETYMGWRLIYRDAVAMRRLAATIPASGIASADTIADPTQTIVYLDICSQ